MKNKFPGENSPFILFSDEWYILGDMPFPNMIEYGDVDLLENGVGQVQSFLNTFHSEALDFPKYLKTPSQVTIVTGILIFEIFSREIIPVLNQIKNLHVQVIPIINKLYGESITVSGLLSGRDIIDQLSEQEMGDEIWISHRILNDDGVYTLDNMTLKDITQELQRPIKVGKDSFQSLLQGISNV